MDTDQIKTFLAVVANGSFLQAASRLYVTQSTVSSRIQTLENDLGVSLFIRNRSGAKLTAAGKRLVHHAQSILLTLDQARHDVGLPSRYRASITIGARIALWEVFLPRWVGEMRRSSPDISIRSEIGFEEDLMRRMIEGTMDVALMYTPQHSPGLRIEQLFDETLVLLTTDPDKAWPDQDYIYVDWGPAFHAQHSSHYPELERPAQTVNIGWLGVQIILSNGGSCFVPLRMAEPLLESGRLFQLPQSPQFNIPVYMVYADNSESVVIKQVTNSLRQQAAQEQQKTASQ
ncbi:MAG: LysR family transcriptional regulator [Gammaproteobacteria bacterium]|nr:LysR family transcriptional regulator [Gammaproteobacteria bacterium]